jgi:RNA polymerase sigma-54 factor
MALAARLELRQGQALVMTPQLMQAIKLLQMSSPDLVAYVEAELEKNPLLERNEAAEPATGPDGGEETPWTPEPDSGPREGDWLVPDLPSTSAAIADRLDADLGNVFPDDAMPERPAPAAPEPDGAMSPFWSGVGAGGSPGEGFDLEGFAAGALTLADHLAEQLTVAERDPKRRLIGLHLIDLVDEAGYLGADLEEVAARLGAATAEVLAVLRTIQRFDPPGIAARSLSECLSLQLAERDRLDPAMAALVANLDLLARRDWAALRRVCGVDEEDLADMVAEVKALSPKPGLAFGSAPVQAVVPDVFVRPAPDGGWHVELNPETLPKVLVNGTYYARVSKTARSDKDKGFLSECFQTANWLVKSLDQRARTIVKVASEIVRQQDGFLVHGVEWLRPLNLRTVADAIGMHESTVSRVTSNKYLGTPRGVFEMKYFFTAAIASAEGGQSHSAESVRFRIRQLIEAEPADAVLSDDGIVDALRRAGVDIARRTVAKYREGMRIPSSVERRRLKGSAAGPGMTGAGADL